MCCQNVLSGQESFRVKNVAGAKSRKALAQYIKTRGWIPSDVSVHIADVAHLILTLGGKELYGNDDLQLIVLRELIQNATDAIHARRLLENNNDFGKISIRVHKVNDKTILSVTDNGVGMSIDTISNSLLNFGTSFWRGESVNVEFPGLRRAGFQSVGKFGIGFFSTFMIADSVEIETRRYTDGLDNAHLVKFPSGLSLAPIFSQCTSSSTAYSTTIRLILSEKFNNWPVEYEAKRNKMNEVNFKVPFSAMLATLVAGLDVDVYYQEFDKAEERIHHRIDAKDMDKRTWLRALSLADYQNDKGLDDYIEANYSRLRYLYDTHHRIAGLAAVGTRFQPNDDFLGGTTVGGLLSGFHSRNSENWIGVIDKRPNGAKRNGGDYVVSGDVLKEWALNQIVELTPVIYSDFPTRFRLQLVMHFFKVDPMNFVVAAFFAHKQLLFAPLNQIVSLLSQGNKLIYIDSDFSKNKENEGHGDTYIDFIKVASLLQEDEILYHPLMNSDFLTYKLINGVPNNDFGFIDCLYRKATDMGFKLKFSYRNNFAKNIFNH